MKDQACICTHVRRGARSLSALYDEALSPAHINVAQFSLLRYVERLAPIAVSDLARATGHERSTLARSLHPLAADGRILIRPGRDRRQRVVTLTPTGRVTLDTALPYWREAQREVDTRLGGRQRQLLSLLADLEGVTP
ncbi:MarR family winged helix-turn-helix transcriptional regulator [Salinisphaera aquimarina]|uniref:MarR family winged helix-turn-helix transcriptional regulator n=1 Tax=Salinisphaera aquimarina TaxID=2094031 RepID=A0ABV7ELZ2_9GAMM